jgi:lysine-N-methylase
MSTDPTLPFRPRLADHVVLRRYVTDGREHVLIKSVVANEVVEIDPRTLRIIMCVDGTRDLGGVMLAAVRAGVYRRASEIHEVLLDLCRRGFLVDGIESGPPAIVPEPARPLEPLDGYTLTCDANGTCCGNYSAIAFLSDEIARARALAPDLLNAPSDRERGLLPIRSSAPTASLAVTMVDGHCPYLTDDGKCRIQLAAGPAAKPAGCRIFPATMVDDGTAIRVSVSVECPCILASLDRPGGEPLIPAGAVTEADLIPGSPVIRLPESIEVTGGRTARRRELRAWSEAVLALCGEVTDPLAAFWTLADVVRDVGLSPPDASAAALLRSAPPSALSIGLPLMLFSSRAQGQEASLQRLGPSSRDRTYQLAVWLARGARALLESTAVEEALAGPGPRLEHERFYFRATIHGHHLATAGLTLERALRDRVLRLVLARQLSRLVPEECAGHPAVPFPLVAVEAMMRGQGLESYLVDDGR